MSVSISQIVADANQFEQQQQASFKQFIEVSKQLKGAVVTAADEAQKQWDENCVLVQSVADSSATGQSSVLEILESDSAYVKGLQAVSLLITGFNKPEKTDAYMSGFQKNVDQLLTEAQAGFE
ncbi:hypothetical protein [Gynuella sunshinyii]|uniref:Uncharacterized protein n=1 Tax=Gynuella sunshinyii YC6258 TaxID=1445510 RepID=A0A0C5VT39_9GAMM|nr:hypothetical protein [Gynuella sunshinyii]AJQ97832.1 hypothetical Protein YC6258_05804 [Gynuella sunshinyii YC6258]